MIDQQYTMVIDESLDYEGNRGAMTVYKQGNTTKFIFSYDTNEVFEITDQSCKVYTVEQSPFNLVLGPLNITGRPHIFTGPASLRFTSDNTLVYNGTANVRGIPALSWYTCLTWPKAQGHIKATYFFSEVNWNTPSPQQQSLLRVEVQGLFPQPNTTFAAQYRSVHHIYDFVGYLPYVDSDPSLFETPSEVVCQNRTNVRNLPKFQTHFQYRAEIIDSKDSAITHYAIWYDETTKLVREDSRKTDPTKTGAAAITSTITEIHDFNTGVRYIIDRLAGCTVESILPSEADTDQDVARFRFNGSLDIDIRDPNSFFVLNHNYTYTGWRKIRGLNCDVFSTIVPGYVLENKKFNAIFEYAFLTDGWTDIPLYTTETDVQNYPVQLMISIPSISYSRVYNFYEFAEGIVSYPVFDISTCFDETQKIGFQLTFPGAFTVGLQAEWTYAIYQALVTSMQVNPVRIGGISITYDEDNVYANAYLLGSAVLAQFNYTGFTLEREDDKVIKSVMTKDECAGLCVDNGDFTCQSFQYCPQDGFACRLGKNTVASKGPFANSSACDGYSRIVKDPRAKEPFLQEAYSNLQTDVNQGSLQVQVTESGSTNPTSYSAINVQLVSGKIVKSKDLPTLPKAFSYRMEIVIPKSISVQEIYIWYDQNLKMVRYDTQDPTSDTNDYMTIIHDFNSGVAFEMNHRTGECTEMPIPSSKVFDVVATGALTNGAISVSMKTSSSLFFLDDTYTYVGEGTARGIQSDVFESRRDDFNEDHHNTTAKDTIFKYYFQSGEWTYMSPSSTTGVQNQPVQLNVEVKSSGDFYTYNFYDFTERSAGTNYFDTTACYTSDEIKTFVLIFSGQPYHPTLDDSSAAFLKDTLAKLAKLTFMSPINFQRTYVTYDDNDIYVPVTVLGHISQLDLFTPDMSVSHNTTDNMISALSSGDCAAACVDSSTVVCNSFDYCPSATGPNCLLGSKRSETAGDATDDSGSCTHFSRTENDTYTGMTMQKMYLTVTNSVYGGKFNIPVQLLNGTNVTFTATSVRDDILSPYSPVTTQGGYMSMFTSKQGFQLSAALENVTHSQISLTDCAMYCIQENTFDCQAFDYQFILSTCKLSSIHPDELNSTANQGLTPNQAAAVFSRFYTADYTKYDAVVYDRHPDKSISNVKSDELCARACTINADFTCEAFDICDDGACQLRRTHTLDDTSPAPGTPTVNCVHYSRNHLYDFIRRDNQIIVNNNNIRLDVTEVADCARLCGTGEGLPYCASFEICQVTAGVTECTLSTADPTVQKNLVIENSMECTLYTRANPPSSGGNPPVTTKGPLPSTSPYTGPSTSPYTGTTQPGKSQTDKICSQEPASSSDTGVRVGIAFGTLFLGLLVGAACTLLFVRIRYHRRGTPDDVTVLKTWDN